MNLTLEQTDALCEVINIGVGRAAASLGQLVGDRIELRVPSVRTCSLENLAGLIEENGQHLDTLVVQEFDGGASGRSLLGFSQSSGIKLAQLLGGNNADEDLDHLDFDLCGILEEVGNIVLNAVLGSLSNMMNTSLTYSVPELHTGVHIEELLQNPNSILKSEEERILLADAHFQVANRNIQGSLVIAFELNGINTVLTTIMNTGLQS